MIRLVSDDTAKGQRVDQWLAKNCPEMSRSRLQALIREGQLKINQLVIREPKTRLKTGDSIEVFLPEPVTARPKGEAIDREILYVDDDLIVINKPAGLVIHPDNGNETGTMVNAVVYSSGFSLFDIGSL